MTGPETDAVAGADESAVRKAFRRIVPLLILFYVLSYVDRINVGFAALTMNKDLGLTAAMFGFANTAFYIMFSLFEIPSNVMMAKIGARIWIPRIMITWGIASMATMFAVGPYSLYGLRSLVGLAEAGLMPGILFYMGHWFPKAHRARANGLYLMSVPIALMVGSPVSGLILQMDGLLGLEGWRWLFIIEGLPPVLLGAVVYFILPDRPQQAGWLTEAEKTALQARLDREHAVAPFAEGKPHSSWREITTPRVLVLAACYFCILATSNTLGIWTPQIVKEFLGNTDRILLVSVVTAIPPFFSIFAMHLMSLHSDRKNERLWHTIASMTTVAVGWTIVALVSVPLIQLFGLILCFSGSYSAMSIFWATVSQLLSRQSQAVGIAFISMVGTFASILSPSIIGLLRDFTKDFNAGIWYATALLVVGVILMSSIARARPQAT
jgi:ACS family 4-hydroxyphenylacetate permease-like MFS transporter